MLFLVSPGSIGVNVPHHLVIVALKAIAVLAMQCRRNIPDIITLVAVTRESDFDTTEFQIA